MTHLWGNFKLFDNSQLKEHADAGLDEVELCHREVTEGEQVQALSIHVVSYRAGCSLHNKHHVEDKHSALHRHSEDYILCLWNFNIP